MVPQESWHILEYYCQMLGLVDHIERGTEADTITEDMRSQLLK